MLASMVASPAWLVGKAQRRRGGVESERIGRGGAGSQATSKQEGEQVFHRFHDGTHRGYRSAI
jgi:hypothetical protein